MDLLKNMIGGEPTKGLDIAAASMAISKIVNTKGQDSNSILQALKLFLNTQERGKNQLVDTVRDFVNTNSGTSVAIINGIKDILTKNAPKQAQNSAEDSNIASVAGNLIGGFFGK